LKSLPIQAVEHSHGNFHPHLLGVYQYLCERGQPEHVCLAGLFHSIYGTDGFQEFNLPLSRRADIQELIGCDSESLVYAFCAHTHDSMRGSLETGSTTIRDRFLDCNLELSKEQWQELLWLKLADVLEQDPRWLSIGVPEGTAGLAHDWRIIAKVLGPEPLALWDATYACNNWPMIRFTLRKELRKLISPNIISALRVVFTEHR